MNERLVMLISGTRKGIGKYLAEYYLKKGYQIVGCSRNDINFKLEDYKHFNLDITDEQAVKKMFKEIRKTFGRLDVLINNAGVHHALMPVLLVPYNSALKTITINFLGTFLMSREAAKLMMKNNFGRIINFSSMAVKHEVKGEAIYTSSKAAIISLTRIMAKELYGYGITCNVIAPSAIKTDMLDNINEEELNNVLRLNVIDKLGKMKDVSNAIDWIIRSESDSITSQVIFLGGA